MRFQENKKRFFPNFRLNQKKVNQKFSFFQTSSKKGQVTIFVIVAILLVASVAGYFLLRDNISSSGISPTFDPVYTSFLFCVEEATLTGVDVLETQAGYIYLPDFESGSTYMPFSSQLNLLGNPIPYWYYVSGNNVQKEQVPSKSDMEDELKTYLEDKISSCTFDSYYDLGYEIHMETPKVEVGIFDDSVEVDIDMDLNMSLNEESALVKRHNVVVTTALGNLYSSALEIYEKEQDELFLENYGLDVLRTYAPVDGVELTCSPLTWNAEDVFDELADAIELNTLALRGGNNDYSLSEDYNKYFVLDLDIDEDVRFLNSQNWASSYEVDPSEGFLLLADPVGYQEGLGMLGFCYVPYHFVYSIKYPVLAQVSSGNEIFQFPMAVVIDKNKAREGVNSELLEDDENSIDVCSLENSIVEILTYNEFSMPVDANVSFECFGKECDVGETSEGYIIGKVPQCVNGYVIAKAEGYKDAKVSFSSLSDPSVDVIMEKLYDLEVDLRIDGQSYRDTAIISFTSNDSSVTIAYPDTTSVELGEDQYEVQVYAYKSSSMKLDATTYEQCYDAPVSGFGGFIGLTEEKCVNVEVPAQIVSNALFAGGKENYYIVESELMNSNKIVINADSLTTPTTLDDLQQNYIIFETKDLEIYFE